MEIHPLDPSPYLLLHLPRLLDLLLLSIFQSLHPVTLKIDHNFPPVALQMISRWSWKPSGISTFVPMKSAPCSPSREQTAQLPSHNPQFRFPTEFYHSNNLEEITENSTRVKSELREVLRMGKCHRLIHVTGVSCGFKKLEWGVEGGVDGRGGWFAKRIETFWEEVREVGCQAGRKNEFNSHCFTSGYGEPGGVIGEGRKRINGGHVGAISSKYMLVPRQVLIPRGQNAVTIAFPSELDIFSFQRVYRWYLDI